MYIILYISLLLNYNLNKFEDKNDYIKLQKQIGV